MSEARADKPVWRWLLYVAPSVLAMLSYLSALRAGFVFDDNLFLELWCWRIEEPGELLDMLSRPGCGYRRVRYLSLAVDHLVWGTNPFGYHLTNVLLHGATTLLVVGLLRRLGIGLVAASLGALLWALHPVHTDVVTYVAGRRDLLMAFFFLASLAVWPWRISRWWTALARSVVALVLFAVAFESKEMAITLPAIVALCLMTRSALAAARTGALDGSGQRHRFRLPAAKASFTVAGLVAGLALASAAFVYRVILFPMTRPTENLLGGDVFHHVLSIPALYAKYAELIVAPFQLYGDYSDFVPAAGLGDPRVWLGVAVLGGIWLGGLWFLGRRPYLGFGLLWLGVTMLPVSQIVPHHEALAEHYLYLPLVGLAIAGARGIELGLASARWRRAVPVVVGALAVVWSVTIVDRNRDFESEVAFASAVLEAVPDSIRGRLTLAHAYQTEGDLEAAIQPLVEARNLAEPGTRFHAAAQRSLLVTLAGLGRLDEAESQAFALLRGYPAHAYALRILGTIRARQGYPGKALVYLERVVEAQPRDVEGHLHLGVTLMQLGRYDEAEPHLRLAATRWRFSADAQLRWGLLALARGELEAGRDRLLHVLELDPTNVAALEQLFLLAQQQLDREAACAWFARLTQLRDDLPPTLRGCSDGPSNRVESP